jgi:hypothetical protein
MKMISKVFLVIAILLICLIAWNLFLGDGGIIQNGWNGIATSVNATWKAITGSTDDVMPKWNSDGTANVGDGTDNLNVGGAGGSGGGPGSTGP